MPQSQNVEYFMVKSTFPNVIRWVDLVTITALSRSTLAEIQNPKSPRFDSRFPPKIRLGHRAVGWMLKDVEIWLNERKVQPLQGGATK